MSEILDPVVPHGWTWQPLDSLATVLVSTVDKKSYEGELPVRLCNYTDVYYNDEITAGMDFMHATATPSQLLRFGVKAGDVVITKDSETSDDIGRPAYIPKDLNGVVYGYHLAIYTPFDLRYGKFIRYIFDSAWVRAQLHVRTPGVTRVGLNQDTLKNLKIPVPSPSLAVKIADFLDRETAEIDAFIADQERLIELLEERRAATITHAVTKGLNPNVPMKDSGIDWLGRVPSGWRIHAIKMGAYMSSGTGFPHKFQGVTDEAVAFHKVSALGAADADGIIRKKRDTVSYATARELGATVFPTGSIVLAKIGAALLLGRIRSVEHPFCIDNNMLAVTPRRQIDRRFLYYALQIVDFSQIVNPGAVPSLDMTAFRDYKLAFPSREEQSKIAEFLDREMAELDAAISDAREAIALSRERRAALISAAVTGQLDVTQAQSPGTPGEVLEQGVRV